MKERIQNIIPEMSTTEQVDFLNSILESSTEYSIIALDLEGLILAWNEGAHKIYGYEAKEVVGKAHSTILYDLKCDNKYEAEKIFNEVRITGKWSGEIKRVRKDGTEFIAFVTKTLRRNSLGQTIGFSIISRDLTDSQKILRELREAKEYSNNLNEKLNLVEDRARIFMENSNEGMFVTNLQGEILEVNKSGLDLYKRPAHEVIGHNYTEFLVSGQAGEAVEEYKKGTEGPIVGKNVGISRPDGSIMEVDFSSTMVQIGKEHLMFSVAHDVTERNAFQRKSIQSEKLATMGTLTAGVAHEINNPLNYVLTNVELLSEWMSEVTPETLLGKKTWMEKSLKHIKEGLDRVKVIAYDLKVFSRSRDSEKDSLIDLENILESSINMASHEIKYRAKIIKNLGKISQVKAHEGRLGQVFLNLLLNAAQAIPEGNATGNEIRVTTEMHSGKVAIDIQDTGAGISPEVIKRLFTPFFTTKPAGLGTGLGLSICQNIIKGFGGEISVESRLGHGTTFHILLPATKENEEPPKKNESDNQLMSKIQHGRILIIDDEPDLAEIFGQVLSQHHEVVVMTNGRKALDLLLKDNNFDVILSDLTMPDMTGADLYVELKKAKNGAEKRIVFVTGGVFTQRARDFLQGIPNKLVEKPLDRKVLQKLVQELVQKERKYNG